MRILVTGGAGYIGSVAAQELIFAGYEVVIIDNLSKGRKELIPEKATFYDYDLNDPRINDILKDIDAVMHFAAYKAAGESMKDASKYSGNISSTINLLDSMIRRNVKKIIFSSSAAVYGIPEEQPTNELAPINPINYYGYTKLACENIINWYSHIHDLSFVALRYFNVAGDGGLNYIDPDAENILPIIMEVVTKKRDKLIVFGDDYPTSDGTCIRDYIHVKDLVEAHIKALDLGGRHFLNLGSKIGYTVMELIKKTEKITGKKIPYEIGPRREGDPASLIASTTKAEELLGFIPKKSMEDMIKSTYDAYTR
ncbi:MAG: UDP-glucose 4-epimerase GalE [Candidatus Woesearchaeota archaeon]